MKIYKGGSYYCPTYAENITEARPAASSKAILKRKKRRKMAARSRKSNR